MKKIIASILAAGAASLAIAGTANAAEPCAPAQVQRVNFREHERYERLQARRRMLERLRHERMERRFGYDRW